MMKPPLQKSNVAIHEIPNASQLQLPKEEFKYRVVQHIGSGAFGTVFQSISKTGNIVAVKKVFHNPHFKNRELEVLKSLKSKYCLSLLDYYTEKEKGTNDTYLFLVTEFLPMSLRQCIKESKFFAANFDPILHKLYSYQILSGLRDIHALGIAHRDIKPENILVNPLHGDIKICDFGSSKFILNDRNSVPEVGSLNYRAPELLLGNRTYSTEIDIWAAGCVIAEMALDNIQMFPGTNDTDQMEMIVKVLGQPTPEEDQSFPHPIPFPKEERIADISIILPYKCDPLLIDLLKSIFVYDPSKRPTAAQLMKHDFFKPLFSVTKLPNGAPMPKLAQP